MKLKPLVTSLFVLGLVSGPVLAATSAHALVGQQAKGTALDNQTIMAQEVLDQNSAVASVCNLNWQDRVFVGGFVYAQGAWGNRQPIGSFAEKGHDHSSTDMYAAGSLYVDGVVNDWVSFHFHPEYVSGGHTLVSPGRVHVPALYSNTDKPAQITPFASMPLVSNQYDENKFQIDEAYIDIKNFARMPFYGRFGWQYLPVGSYERYPMVLPMTQFMTQTSEAAANIGVITNFGLYAQAFAFNGATIKTPIVSDIKQLNDEGKLIGINGEVIHNSKIANYGGKIGFAGTFPALNLPSTHYDLNVSYLRNIYDADFMHSMLKSATLNPYSVAMNAPGLLPVSNVPSNFMAPLPGAPIPVGYLVDNFWGAKPVGLIAVHGSLSMGPFDLAGNYSTALNNLFQAQWANNVLGTFKSYMDVSGVPADFIKDFVPNSIDIDTKSRLWAADLTAGYAFQTLGKDSHVKLSYQWTGGGDFSTYIKAHVSFDPTGTIGEKMKSNAVYLSTWDPSVVSIPHKRWMGEYHITPLKNTDLGFAFVHDTSYPFLDGINGKLDYIKIPYSYQSQSGTIVLPAYDSGTIKTVTRDSNTALVRVTVQF
jgi:hypothetical protein